MLPSEVTASPLLADARRQKRGDRIGGAGVHHAAGIHPEVARARARHGGEAGTGRHRHRQVVDIGQVFDPGRPFQRVEVEAHFQGVVIIGHADAAAEQAGQPVGLVEIEPRAGEAEALFQPQYLGQPRGDGGGGVAGRGGFRDERGFFDRAVVVVQQRRRARVERLVAGDHRAGGAVERDVRQLGADGGRQGRDQIPQRLAPDAGAFVFFQGAEGACVLGDDGAFGIDDATACARCSEINP